MFEAIYTAAVEQNTVILGNILKENNCIDVHQYKNGLVLTPVMQLAFEGNASAVEFLLDWGANLNSARLRDEVISNYNSGLFSFFKPKKNFPDYKALQKARCEQRLLGISEPRP